MKRDIGTFHPTILFNSAPCIIKAIVNLIYYVLLIDFDSYLGHISSDKSTYKKCNAVIQRFTDIAMKFSLATTVLTIFLHICGINSSEEGKLKHFLK